MKMSISLKKPVAGFTLIELMIVVAIIGILASLAIPSFKVFQAKARQAESRTNLNQIYVLQESYYVDANGYASFAGLNNMYGRDGNGTFDCDATTADNIELGFRISSCTGADHAGAPRYGYYASAFSSGAAFVSFATTAGDGGSGVNKVMPGCPIPDIARIDNTNTFNRPSDSVKLCEGSSY